MPDEPKNLVDARALLSKFEAELDRPESLTHLSLALSLLSDVASDPAYAEHNQICLNIVTVYARKVMATVQPLLTQNPPVTWESVDH